MTKTQYYTAASLDGFIADQANSLDWLLQFGFPSQSDYPDFIRDIGALAMGSTTYEWILARHIRPASGKPSPWPYAQPTWVFSSVPGPTTSPAIFADSLRTNSSATGSST